MWCVVCKASSQLVTVVKLSKEVKLNKVSAKLVIMSELVKLISKESISKQVKYKKQVKLSCAFFCPRLLVKLSHVSTFVLCLASCVSRLHLSYVLCLASK